MQKVNIYDNIPNEKWDISYYSDKIFQGISCLPKRLLARYVAITDRMVEHGPDIGMPHTKALGTGLFEMRLKSQEGIARVFYCLQQHNIILILHSFVKRSQATPTKELTVARKRKYELEKHV